MIPVLIIPVIRPDEATRTLASIDVPVGRLVVVDVTPKRDADYPGALHIRPLVSLGIAGAINAGISQTPDAPWWMFTTDLVYGPGDLAEIAALMELDEGPAFVTGDRNDDRLLRNAYGAVNRAAISAVGLLDEWTFSPLYFDDDDWERRCRLGGVEWVEYNGEIGHDRSSTIRDPRAAEANALTFGWNAERYLAKWGGPPGAEQFQTPWNLPVPLSFTPPDIEYRARVTAVWSRVMETA